MGIKHTFVSQKSDGGDATVVRPSNWNEEHTISGIIVSERAPSLDEIIGTGKSAIIVSDYTIASGCVLDLRDDSIMEIL